MSGRRRQPTPEGPATVGTHDGLAYSLWLPAGDAVGAMVVLHGAGSCKENHHDMARAGRAGGFAVVVFDLRGHGPSEGEFGAGALDDVAVMAELVVVAAGDAPDLPLVLRGSSLGGWLAICAAERANASAVVAVCPATSAGLLRGLREHRYPLRADVAGCEVLLAEHDPLLVVEQSIVPLMLLHAEGDESVPVEHTRELARRSAAPQTRLVVVPGGDHHSAQHDPELQGESLRWLRRVL